MRPQILFPLFSSLDDLQGIGPKLLEHFERLCGPRVLDLLWHFPTGVLDRSFRPKISRLEAGRVATLTVTVDKHQKPPKRHLPYRVIVSDDTGTMSLVFFNARGDYLKNQLPVGEERIISGQVEVFQKTFQMVHPDYILKPDEAGNLPKLEPLYPLTYGLTQRVVLKTLLKAMERLPNLPEWQDEALLKREMWPAWKDAVFEGHEPVSEADTDPGAPARRRLAYDEFLANQLTMYLVRAVTLGGQGRAFKIDLSNRDKILKLLPFSLTEDQKKALSDIDKDMAGNKPMLRLLQGDVGSGKTIVALLSMVNAVGSGAQAAIMAPTEILCQQHYAGLKDLCEKSGIKLAILTGRHKGKIRAEILEELAAGNIDILIGTHALFTSDVTFKDLGVVVVDEQHRFGVHQRLALREKGKVRPDMLVMTATPIPRSLALTVYGDMEVSRIIEKPPGRKPIDTRIIPIERLGEVEKAVARAIGKGERVFWVTPLVEDSEKLPFTAAEARYKKLKSNFGDWVGMIHGRMKGPERDKVMERFQKGEIQILVATTVIEVGIDVPEATIMVIEHAERFGLAQLHQLRGRVGRGERASYCLLLPDKKLSEKARERLKIMRETEDGFLIAEKDLALRGAGEFLGVRQSGMPEFRVASIEAHGDLLHMARGDARLTLEKDPKLTSERGKNLRTLLYLFERDTAVEFLGSG